MKRTIAILLLAALCAWSTVISRPTQPGRSWQNTPELMPNSATDVLAEDCYVDGITLTLSRSASAAVTVDIYDKQGTPTLILSLTIQPGENYGTPFPSGGRYAPGGVRWVAGTASAVVAHIWGHYPGTQ